MKCTDKNEYYFIRRLFLISIYTQHYHNKKCIIDTQSMKTVLMFKTGEYFEADGEARRYLGRVTPRTWSIVLSRIITFIYHLIVIHLTLMR